MRIERHCGREKRKDEEKGVVQLPRRHKARAAAGPRFSHKSAKFQDEASQDGGTICDSVNLRPRGLWARSRLVIQRVGVLERRGAVECRRMMTSPLILPAGDPCTSAAAHQKHVAAYCIARHIRWEQGNVHQLITIILSIFFS